jgi:acyl-CoA synthetase (AMP-forming)/AMP-acid ligase II
MNGYWSASTEGATASRGDWLVTSDVGYWDSAGNLWFCGRRTDSIRTGGETVLAGEVERVLALHPSIVDAAVFGLPDDKFGHAVACAIVVGPQKSRGEVGNGKPLTLSDIRNWCEHLGLAGYKRPRHVYRVDSIPKNSSGKTLKYLLVERFSPRSITATNSGPSSKL